MARKRYAITENKIARFHRERRGRGAGTAYRPWLTVLDVPSLGRSSRPLGMTTDRVHHLLSDLEYRVFLAHDFDAEVIDLREQFPLDRDETRRIASNLEVPHPRDPHTGVDVVMTTDLVVDRLVAGDLTIEPIFVKYAKDLSSARVIAKLEIERRYWAARGRRLQVRTEIEYPKAQAEVLAWIAANYRLVEGLWPTPGYWRDRANVMIAAFPLTRAATFNDFDHQLRRIGFASGEAISVLRYLLARHRISMADLARPFSMSDPMKRFRLLADDRSNA